MAESLAVGDDPELVSKKNGKESNSDLRASLRLGEMSSDTLPPELDVIEEEFHRVKLRSVSSADEAMLEEVVQEVLQESHSAAELAESKEIVLSADEDIVEEAHQARQEHTGEVLRQREEEDVESDLWKSHKKHVFVFSRSGKPIYSRYGSEEQLVTKFGVMQALVSILEDADDVLKSFMAGGHKFVFASKGPILFLAIANSRQSERQIMVQLSYAYHQILSVLTLHQLVEIFKKKPGYDLRLMLEGTEKFIDNILDMTDSDPSLLLGGIRCLPLPSALRQNINTLLLQQRRKEVLFALVIARNRLISFMKPKEYNLPPSDIHLILNLVSASTSFRSAESWMPICLPKFNSSGFLNAYVTYVSESSDVCLFLLSTSKDDFFALQDYKARVVEKMETAGWMKELEKAVRDAEYSTPTFDTSNPGMSVVWHFFYKMKRTNLVTSPRLPAMYKSPEGAQRLFDLYMYMNRLMVQASQQVKLFYHTGDRESLIGWRTREFDLYMIFHPLLSKEKAIGVGNNLYKWIKHEEEKLFMSSFPTY